MKSYQIVVNLELRKVLSSNSLATNRLAGDENAKSVNVDKHRHTSLAMTSLYES